MKLYLGDGVYVDFDGYALVLTTEDGMGTTNRIVLEDEVYAGLLDYVAILKMGAEPNSTPRATPGAGTGSSHTKGSPEGDA